jgi:hypothetical protein
VTLHRRCLALLLVAEDVGHLMDPAIPYTYVGPYICSVYQTSLKQGLQATQVLGQAPLFASCSRLTALALRRPWRLSPAASRGGRPSSVSALRTAAQ